MLLLDGTEEPLDERIVGGPASSVHADPYAVFLQGIEPVRAGILAALVRVDDLRCPVPGYGGEQKLGLRLLFKAIGDLPCHDIPAVHVDDGRQVHEALGHGHIGYVYGPHLVRPGYREVPQEVRPYVLRLSEAAKVRLRVYRLYAHLAQQPSDTLDVMDQAHIAQFVLHPDDPEGGVVQKELVHFVHKVKVRRALAQGTVVQRATADLQYIGLPSHAQLAFPVHKFLSLAHSPVFLKLFFKKSFSTFSSPIWR